MVKVEGNKDLLPPPHHLPQTAYRMAFKYPGSSVRKPIVPPPIPPSKLPQTVAPTPLSKGVQFTAFTLAAGKFEVLNRL